MSDLISRSDLYMNDLIRRKDVLTLFPTNDCSDKMVGLYERVLDIPTAYDVEKVVAELEEAKEKIAREDYCRTKHYIENDCEHKDCFKCCAEYLIDIVRKGGVE